MLQLALVFPGLAGSFNSLSEAHRDLFLQAPLDAHGHGCERGWAGAACPLQPQVDHWAVNLHKLHVSTICRAY